MSLCGRFVNSINNPGFVSYTPSRVMLIIAAFEAKPQAYYTWTPERQELGAYHWTGKVDRIRRFFQDTFKCLMCGKVYLKKSNWAAPYDLDSGSDDELGYCKECFGDE